VNRIVFYRLATTLILGGFAMLCQPWSLSVFSAGFPIIVLGVVVHIVLDHWPERTQVPESSEPDR